MAEKGVEDILKKYRERLGEDIQTEDVASEEFSDESAQRFSVEYERFRKEALGTGLTFYERWCNTAEQIIKFQATKVDKEKLEEAINITHMNITANGAASFAALVGFLLVILGFVLGGVLYALTNEIKVFLPLMLIVLGLIALKALSKMPIYIATRWRLRASNQMVLCILYIVMYMRHTSNLENALRFSAIHLKAPLSLDLRKVFWDMQIGTYSTIKESIDAYLQKWRGTNLEFVTSFHLIEGSLYEPSESRRLDILDKSLKIILDGTYEKMLKYTHGLQNPITMLHMLGVILPILGLVIFPLLGSFLGGLVKWYHIAFLYNLILPLLVFGYGMNLLAKRPSGYGESEVAEQISKKVFDPFWLAFFIIILFVAVGTFPLLVHAIDPKTDVDIGKFKFLGYEAGTAKGEYYGPFGLGAMIFSFFIPIGIAIGLSVYYRMKSKDLVKLREETKNLELEFGSALFQLGTRIGDGVPVEYAFSAVAETMQGTPTGNFFRMVDTNIRSLGMSVHEAIFNPQNGAILSYPSPLIESSMQVLEESSRKGPNVVSQSLLSISQYVENIHKVEERLKDMLAEIIASMKSQVSFLAPAIAGIVVGISSMIVTIIVGLTTKFTSFAEAGEEGVAAQAQLGAIKGIFNVQGLIPSYFFQIVVGLYVVQMVYVLTVLANGIENGSDKVAEHNMLAHNLKRSVILYSIIALVVAVLFNLMSTNILSGAEF